MTGKTVYLIGAGMSHASQFHLPLMSGFFDLKAVSDELQGFLNWFYKEADPKNYNIEDVMSFLYLSRSREQLWFRRPSTSQLRWNAALLYEQVLEHVKLRLTIPEDGVCLIHERLLGSLSPADTIISFNYDLIIDNCLRKLENGERDAAVGKRIDLRRFRHHKLAELLKRVSVWGSPPPSLMPHELELGFYLKLHGSLDWLYCETEGCDNNRNFFSTLAEDTREGQVEGAPCRECGASLRIFIMPPVATKRLQNTGRVALLWNLALREMIQADRFVVIGISLAPSDFELRWLIRQALALRSDAEAAYGLHVVNPSERDQKAIIETFPGTTRSKVYGNIAKYLDALDGQTKPQMV